MSVSDEGDAGDCTSSSLCKGAREQDGGVGEDGAGAEEAVEGIKRTMKVGPDAGSNDVPEKS